LGYAGSQIAITQVWLSARGPSAPGYMSKRDVARTEGFLFGLGEGCCIELSLHPKLGDPVS